MDIVVWLRSLGLGKYEAAFRENEIDETVLPNLTAEDLKELGVASLWHRRKHPGCFRQQTRPRFKGWGDEHGQFDRGRRWSGRLSYAALRDANFTIVVRLQRCVLKKRPL